MDWTTRWAKPAPRFKLGRRGAALLLALDIVGAALMLTLAA